MAVTVTSRTSTNGVFLEASFGETLQYEVTVRGAVPLFTLTDSKANRLLLSHKDPPSATSPDVVFTRQWPLGLDVPMVTSSHTLGMLFTAAISYTYVVHLLSPGLPARVLVDEDFTSTAPEDWFFRPLTVTLG
jgi:hypothetical protein